MTIEEILIEVERRRKMFHWFIDGIIGGVGHLTPDNKVVYSNRHGISWEMYKCLTPDLISGLYNITF